MKVLLVEDDETLAQALCHILQKNRYDAEAVYDGATGYEWAASGHYDIIILDAMLPRKDGFSIVSDLRRQGVSTPVLMLTAKGEVADKIHVLDAGADDYMTKPFSPAELLAHLRALARRQGQVNFEIMGFADLDLDLNSCDLSCNKKSIHLSFKEFSLMKLLMANPKQTVPKELIIERVWGADSSAEDNNVEAYISFLRKKLKFLGSAVRIETLRKLGYRLNAEGYDE